MKYFTKKSIAAFVLSLAAAAVILLGSCGAAEAFGGFTRSGETAKTAPMERAVEMEELAEPDYNEYADDKAAMAAFDEAAVDGMSPAASGAAPAPSGGEGTTAREEGTSAGTSVPAEQDRKRVYSGYAELLVDEPEDVKMRLTDIAESSGGYVEEILENTVTLRVPAEQFSVLFAGIKKLGDLLDSYEETVDVTEFYSEDSALGTGKGVVVYGESHMDRSPCGTGTTAKMTLLHHRGKLALGDVYKNAGPLGSVFEGRIVKETAIGEFNGIVGRIRGNAQMIGYHRFVVDDRDPFPKGFLI